MAEAPSQTPSAGGAAPWLIAAWFVWTVLVISTLIGAFIIFRVDHTPWEGTDRAVLSVAIIGIVASVFAWMSYEAPRFFRRRARGLTKRPNARYFVNFLFSMFLAWSVSVLGQTCAFIGLPLEAVMPFFFGATWLLFIFHFPTEAKILRWASDSVVTHEADPLETQKLSSATVTAEGALRGVVAVLKARWAVLLAAGGACMLPNAVVGFFLNKRVSNLETLGHFDTIIASVTSIPFFAIAGGCVVLLVNSALGRRELDLASSLASSFRRLPSLIVAVALFRMVTAIGFLLLVVPGIILSVRLYATLPVLMVEEIGPLEAFKRAWTLSRAHQLAIFLAAFAVWLVVLPLAIGPALPFMDFSGDPEGNPFREVSTGSIALIAVLSWAGSTITSVLTTTLATVLYVRITEQHDS